MKCPNCGNENPPDYVFCDECGARLQDAGGVADAGTGAGAPGAVVTAGEGRAGPADSASEGPQEVQSVLAAQPEGTLPGGTGEARAETEAEGGGEAQPYMGQAESAEKAPFTEADAVQAEGAGEADEGPQMPVTEDTIPAAPQEEASPSMPDVVPVTPATMQAPTGGAYSEVSEAPVTGAYAGAGGVGGEWAVSALDQLDMAQQAAGRGDWAVFGQALDQLRRTLEAAASTPRLQPVPSAGAGQQAATAREYMHVVEPGAEAAEPQAGVAPAIEPVPSAVQAPARLVIISTGAELPLPDQEEITIGREDPGSGIFPDIDLTPYGGEEGGVSRRHARILRMGDEYYIEDLQSTNYTKLDGQRLPAHVRERLEDGSRLDFGRVPVIFRRS